MAMTFDDYKNHYGSSMHNDLNSWYRLSNAGFKKQYKTDMQEKNKALMQAQKAYQEATPEQKQAALTNLQNAQKAAQSAKKLYEGSLSGTEKDIYNVGQAAKAAGKAFISGVKQQLPGNKNNQQGQQTDNNTASAQAADTSSTQQTKNNGQQTAEQKGSNIGQKAAKAAGSAIGTIGTAIGTKWNMQQAGKDPTGTSEVNRQIANNHLNMQQATSQAFADRAKQDASRSVGSIVGEDTRNLTKQNYNEKSNQAAADGGASLMQQDNTVLGDVNTARNFKTQREQTAYDRQQEANDEQNVADVLRQDASVMDYNAMQMADYNNKSNELSYATNGQQEARQEATDQQSSDTGQNADEESTGAKDFSFQIPANEVQGVINAVTGHEKGADIRNGGGTPAQQQYYKYLISNGVQVPNVYTPADKFSEMSATNKQAMDAMTNIRSGGNPTKNYVQGKDGKYYAEGTGEKMNEDQITITNALSGNNAAFGWR